MPTKMHSTGITFPDLTTQTTAGGPVTTQYAIGSYIIGRPADITSYNNSTIAGSSLYATGSTVYFNTNNESGSAWRWQNLSATQSATLVNTGSWRCVSIAQSISGDTSAAAGLWVRYA